MNDTTVNVEDIPRIARGPEAARLATAMYDRLIVELEGLDDTEWQTPTVCAPWNVADIVRHMVGAAKGHASMRETIRQAAHGARHKSEYDGNDMDAMNALQVADHAEMTPTELVAALRDTAPRAVAKRMARPRLLGRIKLPMAPGGSTASGMPTNLTFGHLLTAILTRDVFLHRIDIARATGRDLVVDEATEGKIVADVVAEWAERHGQAFDLSLEGAAGGRYAHGEGGVSLAMDALELCWILSGRGPAPDPLLETLRLF